LAAWDRKDPEGEALLRSWDQAHVAELSSWWRELQCLRLALVSVGNTTYNSNDAARWQTFAGMFRPAADSWMSALLSPEILSNSKAIARILEAHELLISAYPNAFEAGDAWELQSCDEQWTVVANKLDEYLTQVGASRPALDPEHPDDVVACRSLLDSL
jgi:hypothetical protein